VPRVRDEVFALQIGLKLRRVREAAGLTLTALAEKLDVTYQQIQKYETGRNRISVQTFYEWCRICGAQAPDLLGELHNAVD